jgi:hypothetical protein
VTASTKVDLAQRASELATQSGQVSSGAEAVRLAGRAAEIMRRLATASPGNVNDLQRLVWTLHVPAARHQQSGHAADGVGLGDEAGAEADALVSAQGSPGVRFAVAYDWSGDWPRSGKLRRRKPSRPNTRRPRSNCR